MRYRVRLYPNMLFLVFFILSFQESQAVLVTIPDANFRAWLVSNYPTCMIGVLGDEQLETSCMAVMNATTVSVDNENISNLEGIQYFISLQTLTCDNNPLNTLPTLPNTLITLVCRSCQLTSLPDLPSGLKRLFCGGNNLNSLPTLPSGLIELSCWGNNLTNLPVLPNSLVELACPDNQLSSLPTLPSNLEEFSCEGNLLTSLPALPSSLEVIRCGNNQLSTLPALPSPTALDLVIAENNALDYGDIEPYFADVTVFFADPQINFDISPNMITALEGEDISLDGTIGGSNNQYEWFRDGISLGSPSSNPVLSLTDVREVNEGSYQVRVTNSIVGSPASISSNLVTVTVDNSLPVELLDFSGQILDNNDILLTWTTLSETDNDYFTLEKSADGNNFTPLKVIPAIGNSILASNYSVVDTEPLQGINYYRLKQTDTNGDFEYFRTIAISLEKPISTKMYPNPAQDWIQIETTFASPNQPYKALLKSQDGKVKKEITIHKAYQEISLLGLAPGTYWFILHLPNSVEKHKIIIK